MVSKDLLTRLLIIDSFIGANDLTAAQHAIIIAGQPKKPKINEKCAQIFVV